MGRKATAANNVNECLAVSGHLFLAQVTDRLAAKNLSCRKLYPPARRSANGDAMSAAGISTKAAKCGMSQVAMEASSAVTARAAVESEP